MTESLRDQFTAYLNDLQARALRRDVVVRNVARSDEYPNISDTLGISPWFKAALVGTYDHGALLGLGWHSLVKSADGTHWRIARADDQDSKSALLIGQVSFGDIVRVDWDGDDFYPFPHLFCFFRHVGQPYESLAYYTEDKSRNSPDRYTRLATLDQVQQPG